MNPQPLKILVVDDNHDNADSLAMLLQFDGHDTFVAYDGHEALAVAAKACPDLALLDINMPGVDGFEIARAVRNLCRGEVFIAAQTGVHSDALRREAARSGFDRFLLKPVTSEALAEVVLAARRRTDPGPT